MKSFQFSGKFACLSFLILYNRTLLPDVDLLMLVFGFVSPTICWYSFCLIPQSCALARCWLLVVALILFLRQFAGAILFNSILVRSSPIGFLIVDFWFGSPTICRWRLVWFHHRILWPDVDLLLMVLNLFLWQFAGTFWFNLHSSDLARTQIPFTATRFQSQILSRQFYWF